MIRKMLDQSAESQLAGPFGKLGRYALKRHWGIEVPERGNNREEETVDPDGVGDGEGSLPCAAADQGRACKGQGKSRTRRFVDLLRRFLSLRK